MALSETPSTLHDVKLRYLLPLAVPQGEFLQSKMEDHPECPWQPAPGSRHSPLPPHSEDTLQSSLSYSIANPAEYRGTQKDHNGISKRLGHLGMYNNNRWVIKTGLDDHPEIPIAFGNAGLMSTKIGLAFIWLDLTFSSQTSLVILDALNRIPNHYPNKKKGMLVHHVNQHPKAFKDYPITEYSVVALLLELACNVSEWCGTSFGESQDVRSISTRALTFGTIIGPDEFSGQHDDQYRSGLEEMLKHFGYQLMEGASPTWRSRHAISMDDRHGYWGRMDTLLFVGTGNSPWIRGGISTKFFGLQEHFLSFILAQGALTMANHIEDDLKESAANRNLESSFLSAFRKRFESAEWSFLQVQWNLDHTLLHMDPMRFNVHHEYRKLLGVPEALDRIQAQSELINAYFTRKFERSLQHFVFWGAVVGAITGLGGINVRHFTSEDNVGISTHFFGFLAISCIGLLTVLWLRSFIVRHPVETRKTGLSLDGWLRWRN